jgi:hypothetical protein
VLSEKKRHFPISTEDSCSPRLKLRKYPMMKSSHKPSKQYGAGPLHRHSVREQLKTMPKLYEQFAKFSKLEVQHFCKVDQQRKTSRPDESPRPSHYNDS